MTFQILLKQYVVSLIGRWMWRGWQEGWIRFDDKLQLGWPDELRIRFKQLSQNMLSYSESLQKELSDWEGMNFTRFWSQLIEMSVHGDTLAQRWESLDSRLLLSPEEIALLAVMVTIYKDWPMLRALRFVMSEQNPGQPRWGFITHFLSETADTTPTESALDPRSSILFRSRIISINPQSSLAASELNILPDVVEYLTSEGVSNDNRTEAMLLRHIDPQLKPALKKITQKCKGTIVIQGSAGAGKIQIARHIAQRLNLEGGYIVDLTPDLTLDMARQKISHAIAMAVLRHDAIILKNVSKWCERWNDGIYQIVEMFEDSGCCSIWLITADKPDFLRVSPECHIRVPMPGRKQREQIWKELAGDKLSENWISQLAGQFLLTQGQMQEALNLANVQPAESEEDYYKKIAQQARDLSLEGLGSLATPEPARVSMDQLIVTPECQTALEDLLMYAKHRKDLAKNWGFERSMPYGLGLAALFCGPPGTGKTYGAQVVATELQLELYRVDLSQLVSKYIGETEKHLAELFNAAEEGEILLLFDEADSIFSKRTEVKSSVDRYANLEVNYLLQRLERFSGVSILTSNFESGIDEAFMRRIRFRVPFDLPDFKARLTLWNKFLSPAIPRSEDVNLAYLAEVFELSGGHIKEAVLRAASIAYGSEQKCVTQHLLVRSAELEYRKLGKLMPNINNSPKEQTRWN